MAEEDLEPIGVEIFSEREELGVTAFPLLFLEDDGVSSGVVAEMDSRTVGSQRHVSQGKGSRNIIRGHLDFWASLTFGEKARDSCGVGGRGGAIWLSDALSINGTAIPLFLGGDERGIFDSRGFVPPFLDHEGVKNGLICQDDGFLLLRAFEFGRIVCWRNKNNYVEAGY
ncbi:hypothetical protein ACFE04_002356 [Oxalis oulophora]